MQERGLFLITLLSVMLLGGCPSLNEADSGGRVSPPRAGSGGGGLLPGADEPIDSDGFGDGADSGGGGDAPDDEQSGSGDDHVLPDFDPASLVPVPGRTSAPINFYLGSVTTITFDLLPDGTVVTDQYKSKGVVFSTTEGVAHVQESTTDPAAGWGADAVSPDSTLAIEGTTTLRAVFGAPRSRVGVVFTDSTPNNPFTLRAYDEQNRLVDEVSIDTADNSPRSTDHAEDTFVGVAHSGGIKYVEMSVGFAGVGPDLGWEIDNFQFAD